MKNEYNQLSSCYINEKKYLRVLNATVSPMGSYINTEYELLTILAPVST